MNFSSQVLKKILLGDAKDAWAEIFSAIWDELSQPVVGDVASEMVRRDKALEGLDLVLSSSAWDLWPQFEVSTPSTSEALVEFWQAAPGAKAVLILDALSLREVPWILQEAQKRGYTIKRAFPTASALPSDTTSFAKALGMPQRSAMAAGKVSSLRLTGATTAFFNQPWRECGDTLPNSRDLFIWHDWPDTIMHDLAAAGPGLRQLAEDAHNVLTSDEFWFFIDRLATGRQLVITADHGYAATGQFGDVADAEQKEYCQRVFGAERFKPSTDQAASHWVPPIDLAINTARGNYRFVLGRRAWSVQGGRKNLAHGGTSLLEVAVPFIELSRPLQG